MFISGILSEVNKKVLVIGGFVVAFVLAVLIIVFLYSQTSNPGGQVAVVLPTTVPSAGGKPFTGTNISFTQPDATSIKTAPIAGGGNNVLINLSSTNPADIIEIQIIPNTLVSVQNIAAIMKGFGLTQSSVTVGSSQIPALRFLGAIKTQNTLQQDVVVFEKNAQVYKIQMEYVDNSVNATYEGQLQQVLNSLATP